MGIMYGIFLQAIDEICPIHALRYEIKKKKKKPNWLTRDVRQEIKAKLSCTNWQG